MIPLRQLINFGIASLIVNNDTYLTSEVLDPVSLEGLFNEFKRHYPNMSELEGLVDDIKKQNPQRERSIIELVSNAIDSGSKEVNVRIEDGQYSVADHGCGMNLYTFIKFFLVPKNTTKTDINETIGRFGLGAYTALAHLCSDDDVVIIETKTASDHAFKATIQFLENDYYINVEASTRLNIGTTVTVKSRDVIMTEYNRILHKTTQYCSASKIMINDEHVNVRIDDTDTRIISKNARFSWSAYTKEQCGSTILVGGITIQNTTYDNNNAGRLVIFLPRDTIISESRNSISLTNDLTRASIQEVVRYVEYISNPQEKIRYINTLYPLVLDLQKNNDSYRQEDNLIVLMHQMIQSILSFQLYPDEREFSIFKSEGTFALSKAILDKYKKRWYEDFSTPFVWHGNSEAIRIANFNPDNAHQVIVQYPALNPSILFLNSAFIQNGMPSSCQINIELALKLLPLDSKSEFGIGHRAFKKSKKSVDFETNRKNMREELCLRYKGERIIPAFFEEVPVETLTQEDLKAILREVTMVSEYKLPFSDALTGHNSNSSMYRPIMFEGAPYLIVSGLVFANDMLRDYKYQVFDMNFNTVSAYHADMIAQKIKLLFPDFRDIPVDYCVTLTPDDRFILLIDGHYVACDRALKACEQINFISDTPAMLFCIDDVGVGIVLLRHTTLANVLFQYKTWGCEYSKPNDICVDVINFSLKQIRNIHLNLSLGAPYSSKEINSIITAYERYRTQYHDWWLRSNSRGSSRAYESSMDQNLTRLAQKKIDDRNLMTIRAPGIEEFYIQHARCLSLNEELGTLTFIAPRNDSDIADRYRMNYYLFIYCLQNNLLYSSNIHVSHHTCIQKGNILRVGIAFSPIENMLSLSGIMRDIRNIDHTSSAEGNENTISEIINNNRLYEQVNVHERGDNTYGIIKDGQTSEPSMYAYYSDLIVTNLTRFPITHTNISGKSAIIFTSHDSGIAYSLQKDKPTIFMPIECYTTPGEVFNFYTKVFYKTIPPEDLDIMYCWGNFKKLFTMMTLKTISPLDFTLATKFIYLRSDVFDRLLTKNYILKLIYLPNHLIPEVMDDYYAFFTELPTLDLDIENEDMLIWVFERLQNLTAYKGYGLTNTSLYLLIRIYGIIIVSELYEFKSWSTIASVVFDTKGLMTILSQISSGILYKALFFLLIPSSSYFNPYTDVLPAKINSTPLSILDLITTQFLDRTVMSDTPDPHTISEKIAACSLNKNNGYAQRILQHAVYHQARPEQALWIRELLQNSLDAIKLSTSLDKRVECSIEIMSTGCTLFRMRDSGVGMSWMDVLNYFCTPNRSSKREASSTMIGGRGVGAFTLFAGAEQLIIKTRQEGKAGAIFHLTSVYDDQGRIVDIQIVGQEAELAFIGTEIFRISRAGVSSEFDAANLSMSIRSHARFIPYEEAIISLNNSVINNQMLPIASVALPHNGNLQMYLGKENSITAGGLYVKSADPWVKTFISKPLQTLIGQHASGLVFDLPATTPLTRERNDFESAVQFEIYIRRYILQCSLLAYCRLFLIGKAKIEELPYDLYSQFFDFEGRVRRRHPDYNLEEIASEFESAGILRHIEYFTQSHEALLDLMCYLKIFQAKRETINGESIKYSLSDLSKIYNQSGNLPELSHVPEQLKRLVEFNERQKAQQKFQSKTASNYEHVLSEREGKAVEIPEKHFSIENYDIHWGFQFFSQFCIEIAKRLDPVRSIININWSTTKGGELACAQQEQVANMATININIFSASTYVEALYEGLKSNNKEVLNRIVILLVDTVAHELTHVNEKSSHETHNRTFWLAMQERVLSAAHRFSDFDNIINEIIDSHRVVLASEYKPSSTDFIHYLLATEATWTADTNESVSNTGCSLN